MGAILHHPDTMNHLNLPSLAMLATFSLVCSCAPREVSPADATSLVMEACKYPFVDFYDVSIQPVGREGTNEIGIFSNYGHWDGRNVEWVGGGPLIQSGYIIAQPTRNPGQVEYQFSGLCKRFMRPNTEVESLSSGIISRQRRSSIDVRVCDVHFVKLLDVTYTDDKAHMAVRYVRERKNFTPFALLLDHDPLKIDTTTEVFNKDHDQWICRDAVLYANNISVTDFEGLVHQLPTSPSSPSTPSGGGEDANDISTDEEPDWRDETTAVDTTLVPVDTEER